MRSPRCGAVNMTPSRCGTRGGPDKAQSVSREQTFRFQLGRNVVTTSPMQWGVCGTLLRAHSRARTPIKRTEPGAVACTSTSHVLLSVPVAAASSATCRAPSSATPSTSTTHAGSGATARHSLGGAPSGAAASSRRSARGLSDPSTTSVVAAASATPRARSLACTPCACAMAAASESMSLGKGASRGACRPLHPARTERKVDCATRP